MNNFDKLKNEPHIARFLSFLQADKKHLIVISILVLAIPFTVTLALTQQNLEQKASGPTNSVLPSPTPSLAQLGERCNEFSSTSRDCASGLVCKLDNPQLPDLGGICVADQAGPGQRCAEFREGSKDCISGYHCKLDNPQLPDLGGVCVVDLAGPGERCGEFSNTSKDCIAGYYCKLDNPKLPDLGGVCAVSAPQISFVKTVGTASTSNSRNSNILVQIPSGGVPVGNTIIVSASVGTFPGAVACTDSRGNVYKITARSGANSLFVCSAKLTSALLSGDVVKLSYPAFSGVSNAVATEFSGVTDVDGTFKTGTSTTSKTVTAQNLTLTNQKDLMLGVVSAKYPFTPASGFTTVSTINGLSVSYVLLQASGTFNTLGTVSSGAWTALLGAYK